MHVSRPGSNEAHAAIRSRLQHVEGGFFGLFTQSTVALEHQGNALAGIARHHDKAAGRFLEALAGARLTLAHRDQGLHVIDARGHAQNDWHLELLGQLESSQGHRVGLLRIRRLEHRHMRKTPPVARILFVLGRRKPDIVGNGDDQTADHTGQRQGHQRIGGDVHAHMLHAAKGARPRVCGTDGHLQRDLLVDRPLGIQIRIGRDHFQHLGGRGARIGCRHLDAGLPDRARHSLVTGQQQPARRRRRHHCSHPTPPSGKHPF